MQYVAHRSQRADFRAGVALLVSIVVCLAAATPASAASALDRIRQSGHMAIGYLADAAPLSSLNASGKPAGYGVALCEKVGAAVQAELKLASLAVDFVPVTNTNVDYAYSDDGGQSWVGGDSLGVSCVGRLRVNATAQQDDQWFPWAAANPTTGGSRLGGIIGTPPVPAPAYHAQKPR